MTCLGMHGTRLPSHLADRSLHVRIAHIVYFEGPLASYR
ncbi:hypothetical protein B8V81_3412 [Paenibacillus pasadenensis]|uniref:Uncharacterized protein n=1 Tax=Paenibacillus pasadenensis TaxID=217090 RepID=A0A2N5N3R6_9BACL|nr:hypothetical protein B8V81_3412 [Paenibacillus pasadenensis]